MKYHIKLFTIIPSFEIMVYFEATLKIYYLDAYYLHAKSH